MERLTDGALARALERGRERYNALFAQARRERRGLDPETFAAHLAHNLAPIADAVLRVAPERVDPVVEALYEMSLDLAARDCVGPGSRYPLINTVWHDLLPALAPWIAEKPQTLAAAITNAVYNLSRQPGARPDQWLAAMTALAPRCDRLDLFLEAGLVLSWRAGMAHYRETALTRARSLPPEIVREALDLRPDQQPDDDLIREIRENPWRLPAELGASRGPLLKRPGRVGGFRGFGGVFTAPPAAFSDGQAIYLADDHACWRLFADCFGATLHRVGPMPPANADTSTRDFKITKTGKVTRAGISQTFPELAGSDGAAATDSTLAVTMGRSHWVHLVARG